jgi:hypothetical protein
MFYEDMGEAFREGFEVTGKTYRSKVTGKEFTRARATIPEARALGVDFEENSLALMLKASSDAINLSVSKDMMRELAEKMALPASKAPPSYVPVGVTGLKYQGSDISNYLVSPSTLKTTGGEQLVFHPKTAKFIEDFAKSYGADEASQEFLKKYDKLQNLFKASVTSIFPAFHGRNAISNVMLNFLDIGYHALSPANHVASGNMIMNEARLNQLHKQMMVGGASAKSSQKTAQRLSEAADNSLKNSDVGERAGRVKEILKDEAQQTGEIRMYEEGGKLFIEDGRHRLQAAAQGGKLPKIVDRTVERTGQKSQIITEILERDASRAAEQYSELMLKPAFTDKRGYTWTVGELRNVVKRNVVAFNPRNLGQIDQVQFAQGDMKDIVKELYPTTKWQEQRNKLQNVNIFSTKNKAVQTGLKVGSLVEDQARLVNFMANLKNTGDPLEAAQRTKQFLFDYQNLSNFERTFMRRIIPFYTFTRKNVALQVKTLFQKPGRIAAEIRAVQTIGDALGGGDLSPEERAALPEWMQDGINTVLSRDGSQVEILSTIGSPIEQPFQQFQPNQFLASISPALRVPVELLSGYSAFHGKQLSEVTNAAAFKSAPQAVKDFIGFAEVNGKTKEGKEFTYYTSLRPQRMHLVLNLPPTQRVLSTIKQLQKPDVETSTKVWQQLVGFNPYEFDLEVEAERRAKENQEELEWVLDKSNVGYSINRFILSEEN